MHVASAPNSCDDKSYTKIVAMQPLIVEKLPLDPLGV
jgi:hypothetical protein